MSKTFELWDTASRNLIGAYASEAEALTYIRAYVREHGPSYPSSWVLLWDDDEADQAGQIAEGLTLLSRAERARSTPDVSPQIPQRRIG